MEMLLTTEEWKKPPYKVSR